MESLEKRASFTGLSGLYNNYSNTGRSSTNYGRFHPMSLINTESKSLTDTLT